MRKQSILSFLFMLVLSFISSISYAQKPELVKDINAVQESGNVQNIFAGEDFMVFTAKAENTGDELWRSDGTDTGTYMLKDINTGIQTSNCRNFATHGKYIYFSAQDSNGIELWRTDGTMSGTILIKDIFTGAGSSNPTRLTSNGDYLFFVAQDATNSYELWRTTDKDTGAVLVKDINPTGSSSITAMFSYNDMVYFEANDGVNGRELWISDGTESGTKLFKAFKTGSDHGYPGSFILYQNRMFFTATDSAHGKEIWSTDGTDTGTYIFKDILVGKGSGSPGNLTVSNGNLFFSYAGELYVTDGDTANVEMVKDFDKFSTANPYSFVDVDGVLFFIQDVDKGRELYLSDGTESGTKLVRDLYPIQTDALISNMTSFNGKLYFTAHKSPDYQNIELFVSDGSSFGTKLLKDINGDVDKGSFPTFLTPFKGSLYFSGDDGNFGKELWSLDTGTNQVDLKIDVYKKSSSSQITEVVSYEGGVMFTANDAENGLELWTTNGDSSSTKMVKDIKSGSAGSSPSDLTPLGDRVYFKLISGTSLNTLSYSDGTEAGTKGINNSSNYRTNPVHITAMGDDIYFGSSANTIYADPWIYDGGTSVRWIKSLSGLSKIGGKVEQFTPVNGTMFFVADIIQDGIELWKTDGTSNGTEMVKDINSGSGDSRPRNLTAWDTMLCFTASNSKYGNEIWITDGTNAGTDVLIDLEPGSGSSGCASLLAADSLLFFTSALQGGRELWRTNGTENGTFRVMDILPGSTGSNPAYLTYSNGRVFFTASDSVHGTELWMTDGTEAGTSMIKDIYAGTTGSSITEILAVRDLIYFVADDGIHGAELWVSDGTNNGTKLVDDLAIGLTSSSPSKLTLHRDTLYFTADHPNYGNELFYVFTNCVSASFSGDAQVCFGESINLTNESDGFGAAIVSSSWSMGDDSMLTSNNVVDYTYTQEGKYEVMLFVEDADGCKASFSKTITVNEKPQAQLSVLEDSLCEIGHEFSFRNNSVAESSLLSSWKFSDGTSSTVYSPKKSFNSAGNKKAELIVSTYGATTNDILCRDTAELSVYVTPKPVNVQIIGKSLTDQKKDTFTVQNKAGSTFAWTATDGTITQGQGTNRIVVEWSSKTAVAALTMQETDETGCKGSVYKKSVSLKIASIGDLNRVALFNVYPNPTDGIVSVKAIDETAKIETITVLDVTGNLIEVSLNMNGKTQVDLDVTSLKSGVYLIYVESNLGRTVTKIRVL